MSFPGCPIQSLKQNFTSMKALNRLYFNRDFAKGFKYIGNLSPHPHNTQFCLRKSGLFRYSFLPFCNCMHEVNIHDKCMQASISHTCKTTYGQCCVNIVTPVPRVNFYGPKFLTVLIPLCHIHQSCWCNTGNTDVICIYKRTICHYLSFHPIYIILKEIECDDTHIDKVCMWLQ
jgi:hypothetical protein